MNKSELIKIAKKELQEETKRVIIDAYKRKLKKRKWYHLPFKIVIIKKEKL